MIVNNERIARMREVLEYRQEDLLLILDNIHDPHNASAILRSADAFGIDSAHFLYSHENQHDLSNGVSGHTLKWSNICIYNSIAELKNIITARKIPLVATVIGTDIKSYEQRDWTLPGALVLGNEQNGCSEEILEIADELITIPMRGFAQSLNVSVAAGIIFSEMRRQREKKGMYTKKWSVSKQRWLDYWVEREYSSRLRRSPPELPKP
tara:strand:+ start:603 stop:1229 length:627 start_codon:yes stop_codon:yes gene_type:complete